MAEKVILRRDDGTYILPRTSLEQIKTGDDTNVQVFNNLEEGRLLEVVKDPTGNNVVTSTSYDADDVLIGIDLLDGVNLAQHVPVIDNIAKLKLNGEHIVYDGETLDINLGGSDPIATKAEVDAVSARLDAEEITRAEKDADLQEQLSKEVELRTNADTHLQDDITDLRGHIQDLKDDKQDSLVLSSTSGLSFDPAGSANLKVNVDGVTIKVNPATGQLEGASMLEAGNGVKIEPKATDPNTQIISVDFTNVDADDLHLDKLINPDGVLGVDANGKIEVKHIPADLVDAPDGTTNSYLDKYVKPIVDEVQNYASIDTSKEPIENLINSKLDAAVVPGKGHGSLPTYYADKVGKALVVADADGTLSWGEAGAVDGMTIDGVTVPLVDKILTVTTDDTLKFDATGKLTADPEGVADAIADSATAVTTLGDALIDDDDFVEGMATAIGDNDDAVDTLKDKLGINDLETAVGDSESGLVKDVADIKSGAIPIGMADKAKNDIDGNPIKTTYEKVENKTTTFSATPGNTKYPTEKLVKDSLDKKLDEFEDQNNGFIMSTSNNKTHAEIEYNNTLNLTTETNKRLYVKDVMFDALSTQTDKELSKYINFGKLYAVDDNVLVDEHTVNEKIATSSGTFRGTHTGTGSYTTRAAAEAAGLAILKTAVGDVGSAIPNNDYAYIGVNWTDASGKTTGGIVRYKAVSQNIGTPETPVWKLTSWSQEYFIETGAFTQSEANALASGITATKVAAYDSHLTNSSNPHNVTAAQLGVGAFKDKTFADVVNGALSDSTVIANLDSKYKKVQTAKTDPTASGTSLTFIDGISQDAQGVITATKKTVTTASATSDGLMTKEIFKAINTVPTPAAASKGKALVVNAAGTGFEFGDAGAVKDVKIGTTSVLDTATGVATIPEATDTVFGAVKYDNVTIVKNTNNQLELSGVASGFKRLNNITLAGTPTATTQQPWDTKNEYKFALKTGVLKIGTENACDADTIIENIVLTDTISEACAPVVTTNDDSTITFYFKDATAVNGKITTLILAGGHTGTTGGGGTSDYTDLQNKPQIEGHVLSPGNNTAASLGLVKVVTGKDLSTNDYDAAAKKAVDSLIAVAPATTTNNTLAKVLDGKKDVQTAVTYTNTGTKYISKIAQDTNGKITVTDSAFTKIDSDNTTVATTNAVDAITQVVRNTDGTFTFKREKIKKPTKHTCPIAISKTPSSTTKPSWDDSGEYVYKFDVAVTGLTANSMIENLVLSTGVMSAVGPVAETSSGKLTFWTKTADAVTGNIIEFVTSEVD